MHKGCEELTPISLVDLVNNVGLLAILLLNRSIVGLELHKVPETDLHSLLSARGLYGFHLT